VELPYPGGGSKEAKDLFGVYLVFASLILPAIATRKRNQQGQLWLGYLLGGFAYASGLLLSLWLDLPAAH
jgi:zinc/manganese transport system permease protein